MNRTIFSTGMLIGVLGIILGAFGAHGLENLLDADALRTFETGVKYQMYHAIFLLVLGGTGLLPSKKKRLPFYLILAGIFLFSFSIYFLATNTLTGFDFKTIGFVTPIGGLLLILGWIVTGYHVWKSESVKK
ncbi:DUF423 domain-containing protein [Maribacter sp. 2307UL18-2]|uniref:DUF423 domain-containing protein n=1 Tax=Maribacter sp. 2307UL18-2 TaxID=3386274 RepID=UPI0039BC6925